MYSSYGMNELAVAPLDANYASAVTAMQFSPHFEALWAGTDSGHLYTLQCPSLQPYAHWHAHPSGPVLEVVAAGDGVMSLSQHRLALHGLGGAPRWCLNDPVGHLTALCLDTSGGGGGGGGVRAVLGRSNHQISVVDLITGKVVVEQDVMGLLAGEGITLLRGPVARGTLCCATSMGRLAMIDPRVKLRLDGALIAAPGGIAALDARGDTVAAAGYGMRTGQVVAENCVKIFDLRVGLRQLYSLPTAGSPAALAFHPLLPTSLLVAMPSAMFCLSDTATGAATNLCQADMASDSLSTATISSSGDLVALGGSGGYAHLWGDPGSPSAGCARVNKAASSVPPPTAPARPKPAVALQEDDSFSAAPQYPPAVPAGSPPGSLPGPLASDLDASETSTVGLPPRVVEPALRREIRVVDGVGYLPNMHYSRSKPLVDMVRELAALRHGPSARLSMKADWADPAVVRAERQRQRAAEGGVVLPLRYQHVEIRHYGKLKWEEFDFSYYNRTRFAGLENDLPNAYCNALLQALYFVPEFRSLVLSHVPEPDVEFCLSCELSFLFSMLQHAVGLPCQATNFLRTLRSLREAAALGLLDGGGIGPAAGTTCDAGAAAAAMGNCGSGGPGSSETELSRRVAALSRFVLEQMHREASNARSPSMGPFRSGISPQPSPGNAALTPALEALMAISFRQRMSTLSGPSGPESVRESRAFQVDLQYPPSAEKAAKAAEEARQLGLNRLPGAPTPMDTPGSGPPTFSELLRRSLLAASSTRAWLDEARGYALVRKMRVPLSLPALLTINVAVGDMEEASWWLPTKGLDGAGAPGEANRLPWAIAVVSRPHAWEVEVYQADRASQLYEQLGTSLYQHGVVSCVYELCGAVFQIRDMDEAADPGSNRTGSKPHQGHLVTMVKVPQQYWDEIPQPRLTKPTPGSLADHLMGKQPSAAAAAAAVAVEGGKVAVTVTATATVTTTMMSSTATANGKTAAVGAVTAPSGPSTAAIPASAMAAATVSSAAAAAAADDGSGGGGGGGGQVLGLGPGISLPDDLDDIFASGLTVRSPPSPAPPETDGSEPHSHSALTASAAQGYNETTTAGGTRRVSAGSSGGTRPRSVSTHGSQPMGHPQGPEWVLFNDFSVSPNCPSHEVTATYANQKLPCLLQYRQVPPPPHLAAAAAASMSAAAAAVVTAQTTFTPGTAATGGGGGVGGRDGKRHSGSHRYSGTGGGGGAPALAATAAVASLGTLVAAAAASAPPVLTGDQFRLLCCAPPLQGPMAGLPPFRFKPLDLSRLAPKPGTRFAIDAEFVASSPPESRTVERLVSEPSSHGGGSGGLGGSHPHLMLQGGVGVQQQPQQHYHAHGGGVDLVQSKQSRLTLARVAVVVAEPGPHAGSCCLDDYVRAVEPVYDYLTRWSGIQPGDLDPTVSRHYTTTLKHTYLKLKHLLDCGCVFVGHDLRKDFRCINMVVPPEQVIDTSELFRHRGGRKLSLRFLASYLLGATLQGAAGPAAGSGGPGLNSLTHTHTHMHTHAHPHTHAHAHAHGQNHLHTQHGGSPGGGGGPVGGMMPQHPQYGPYATQQQQPYTPTPTPTPTPQHMYGHDAVEDARMAMRLYHKYLELVANESFTRVLNEMYAWGKQHGWDPANTRMAGGGLEQQAPAA
ncbi:hypothetical protein Vafri_16832 [Volvox africanus]|uniref:Exonuclease domain-containing protein n=1 Tax=Volvox africanus TaxID=51714 RepID=A0A8J4F9G4_9CHLO|nr:hypothetical protein Vafri_16832 [Volvox africanus]